MNASAQLAQFRRDGWCRFEFDPTLARWVEAIVPAARACVSAPENDRWRRCGGTWFVGVNALPNATDGAVADGMPVAGRAVDFIRGPLGLADIQWDRAQVSVVYRGYPQPMSGESGAAFRYRVNRDAAHVDGLIRAGAQRRRYLRNFHRILLGIPVGKVTAQTAPLVVWERSHEIVRDAFLEYFGDLPPQRWPEQDVTAFYRKLRERIFDSCRRIELTAQRPGEAWVVHRLALHGIAPWSADDVGGPDQRMIVYFRPESASPQAWLHAP